MSVEPERGDSMASEQSPLWTVSCLAGNDSNPSHWNTGSYTDLQELQLYDRTGHALRYQAEDDIETTSDRKEFL